MESRQNSNIELIVVYNHQAYCVVMLINTGSEHLKTEVYQRKDLRISVAPKMAAAECTVHSD